MIWLGIWIPFLGTVLGASCVYLLKKCSPLMTRCMSGIAGGVMVAASIWSLILPSIEESVYLGKFSFVPCLMGLWLGGSSASGSGSCDSSYAYKSGRRRS